MPTRGNLPVLAVRATIRCGLRPRAHLVGLDAELLACPPLGALAEPALFAFRLDVLGLLGPCSESRPKPLDALGALRALHPVASLGKKVADAPG
jgi:hypothetical protein